MDTPANPPLMLVDDRVGSKDLLPALRRSGVPCDLQRLDFADFAFVGRGLEGADVHIGIELKETRDLISSLRSARFPGHQLPGLQSHYDRAWLLTEGIWKASDDGVLQAWVTGGWWTTSIMVSDLETWILSQTIRGGISYWHCSTRKDTIRFLTVLYHWWTSKDLDEHRSHPAIYLPPPDRASVIEPSTFVKMASCLPSIGWEKAYALEASGARFQLVYPSGNPCTVPDLQKVNGIGKTIATRIVETLSHSVS